jgi:hypothetical protein
VEHFARGAGFEVVGEFYDAGVSGADAVDARPGFAEMLERVAGQVVRTIIVETANRFARDLIVQPFNTTDRLRASSAAPSRARGPRRSPASSSRARRRSGKVLHQAPVNNVILDGELVAVDANGQAVLYELSSSLTTKPTHSRQRQARLLRVRSAEPRRLRPAWRGADRPQNACSKRCSRTRRASNSTGMWTTSEATASWCWSTRAS